MTTQNTAPIETDTAFLASAQRAAPETLNKLLCEANWQTVSLPVISWIASRKGVCLTAALHCFFNADPMRFNYLHKNEVPSEYKDLCRALDALCLRINSGFYDNAHACDEGMQPNRLANWLSCQKLDVKAGHAGRWVFRESVLQAKTTVNERPQGFEDLAAPHVASAPKGDWQARLKTAAKQRFARLGAVLNQT